MKSVKVNLFTVAASTLQNFLVEDGGGCSVRSLHVIFITYQLPILLRTAITIGNEIPMRMKNLFCIIFINIIFSALQYSATVQKFISCGSRMVGFTKHETLVLSDIYVKSGHNALIFEDNLVFSGEKKKAAFSTFCIGHLYVLIFGDNLVVSGEKKKRLVSTLGNIFFIFNFLEKKLVTIKRSVL